MFRRARTYWLQGVFLGALLVVLALWWPRGDEQHDVSGGTLFRWLAAIELAVAALVAPALAAPAVLREREMETLGLLAIAGASPLRIVIGKAIGRLAQVFVLVALSMPLVGSLYALGGLAQAQVAPVFIESIALALLGVGIGSFFSASGRRPETAVLATFASLFVFVGVPQVLAVLTEGTAHKFPARHLSPVAWFEALFDPTQVTGEYIFRLWWIAPLAHAGAGALALLVASARLARAGYEPLRSAGREGGAVARIPVLRSLLRLRKRGGPLGLTGRFGTEVASLRWRERASRAVSDGALAIGLLTLIVLFEVFAPSGSAGAGARTEVRRTSALAFSALATLVATTLGAVAVARERDQDTLEPLAAAPLDAEQFLLGKLLGISRAVAICGAAVVLHVAIGAVRGMVVGWVPVTSASLAGGPAPAAATATAAAALFYLPDLSGTPDIPWAAVVAIAGTIPFGLALHAVLGLSFSGHCDTAIKATAWSLAVAVALAAVSKIACLFYGLSPATFCWVVLDPNPPAGIQGTAQTSPLQWIAVAVAAALHAAAVAVVAWNHLRARFDQLVGRAALDIISLPDTISEP